MRLRGKQKKNSLIETDPPLLHFSRCHDDHPGLFLPHHLPEISDGGGETPLGGNVDLLIGGLAQGVLRDHTQSELRLAAQDSGEMCSFVPSRGGGLVIDSLSQSWR